jgi:mono/diheme cytochrome c family protein
MSRPTKLAWLAVALALAIAAGAVAEIVLHGLGARDEPTWAEAFLARRLRSLATPRALRGAENPLPRTPEILREARAHFADHCASCHGNDGRGETTLGRNLYPKAPDLTLPETQRLSDGELFAIIENGIRLSGMPAWGSPAPDDDAESWELVHFIRHLPRISAEELEEMKALNPTTREHAH